MYKKEITIQEIVVGIQYIQDFLVLASKKMPGRNVRGFADHIGYMQDILIQVIKLLKYFDDTFFNGQDI